MNNEQIGPGCDQAYRRHWLDLLSAKFVKILPAQILSLVQIYADNGTITITQNRCFKVVIKDMNTFEEATGVKINLKGLGPVN